MTNPAARLKGPFARRARVSTALILAASVAVAASVDPASADRLPVGEFSTRGLTGWEEHSFEGNTEYTIAALDDGQAVKAVSRGSASILFREIRVDLQRTPYLNWRWRVENIIEGAAEREKRGDDYPARVYVVHDGGIFSWQKRSVNYVWSSNQPEDSTWPNAYTELARMIAVRSGADKVGRWVEEKRNVKEDFARLFQEEIRYVHLVALMSDTDNTGKTATAFYGDIFFSSD